ncbi:phosphoenolpyruvate--protein phosphotransferase [Sandaracinobacteroides saxicola]|uniref:phosphoenolpyruvate--protein phosphotransferase n=1 Tax=Sandaracinobacteroides saxicola TaxID=2759707 RepID=A0A7G5IGN5_9SPHN|nr:phosphoenolpyruvate--protein phosphotransferase [Sandaracinobacteroides saxicola]QMW22527.1 phosphoenolpyruvate--protein phosphotransferase [Sandaracinobacteroides saxicola]
MAISGAREILRRLHDVMAARTGAQAKLNQVVGIIAEQLGSEVASIYLRRDGMLELFATRGLKQEAVHVTRLALGQGLVGTIAAGREALNLAEARNHPNFAYRPETGEDLFHSFAGVPIIRRELAVGVLCVQHVEPREYAEVEIEALQTVAMVLAELIAAAGLVDDAAAAAAPNHRGNGQIRLSGLKLVEGLARGQAVFHQPRIVIENSIADDVEVERARLKSAFARMREQIDAMMSTAEFTGPGDHDEILDTYKMFAYDEGWARRINAAIDSGLTAEAAIETVAQAQRIRMSGATDPYLRERLHDLEDLSNRLIRIVSGKLGTAAQAGLPGDTILIARNLGPAELLEYDRRFLKGVALEEGSLTAHVTIVARAMGIPVLGRVRDLRAHVAEGDALLLDGGAGGLFVRPSAPVVKSFQAQVALKTKRQAAFAKLKELPAITKDGIRIALMMNAGLRSDLPALNLTNADGIGLFRTEFQFMVSATLPRRERQIALYRDVLAAAKDRPVVFRTVDIGGDKAVPYMRDPDAEDENPAMGWRALRLALEREGLLMAQARALLEAAAGKTLNLMFPMVSEPWEFEAARALVEKARVRLQKLGKPHATAVRYGAMLEVPALAEVLDELLPMVDFISIGTNDLTQFLLAADRGNPKLADRYDWLSRAVLRFLARVAAQAREAGTPVTVCGEMGGRPLEALALLGLGIDRFSITPAAIGPVKAMIRSTDLGALRLAMKGWLSEPGTDIRARLTRWATTEMVDLM